MRRILLGCGALLLGALMLFSMRVRAQGESGAATASVAPSVVRTVARGVAGSGLAADPQGLLDYASADRIAKIIPASSAKIVAAIAAGNGERGSLGDGGLAINAELNLADASPKNPIAGSGIAIDPAGNLFVADTLNDTVRRVDAETGVISSVAGKWASIVTPEGFANPLGVAADANGNLYITANNVVYRLDAVTGAVKQIANVAGATAIAVTRDGAEIYVVAPASGNVLRIAGGGATFQDPPKGTAPTNGASALSIFVGASKATVQRLAAAPTGIAIDASGNVFVSEASANIIERVDERADARTLRVTQIAGTNFAGYSGDGGAPLKAQFNAPGALAFDRSGNLFVADTGNSVIREITNVSPAQTGGVTLSPNTFSFGDQLTAGQTVPQAFTLTNNTAGMVTGIAVSVVGGATPADFTQTSSCAGSLAAGASCTINVIFAPQTSGQRTATLYVTDSDPTSPQTASLTGIGDDFELAIPTNGTNQITVIDGETGTFLIQAAPDNAFSGTITLNCPYNLPLQTTCTITSAAGTTPPTLTLTAGGPPQTFNAAFQTTYRTTTTGPSQTILGPTSGSNPRFPAPPLAGMMIACVFLFAAGVGAVIWNLYRGRNAFYLRPSAIGAGIATILIGVMLAMASACSSSNQGSSTQTIFHGTPAGSYPMAITATAQGAARSVNITLIVQ
ncbi:MAG: choice-of-anchor D domain-containing protein [Candidatus Acidiferrales bacterium]